MNINDITPIEAYIGIGRGAKGPLCKCGHPRSAHARRGHQVAIYHDDLGEGFCSCGKGERTKCLLKCSCREFEEK